MKRSAPRRALPLRGSRAAARRVPGPVSAATGVSAASTGSGMSLAGTGMSVTGIAGALAVARTLGGAVARRSAVAMTMTVARAVALTGGPRRMWTSVAPGCAAVSMTAVGADGGEASVAATVGGGDRLPRQPLDVAQQGDAPRSPHSEMAMPSAPARAVRPMRCT